MFTKGERRMKKFCLVALIATLFFGAASPIMAQGKVAVIDVQAVVAKSAQVQALKNDQKQKTEELQKWLKTVRADVEKQKTEEGKAKLVKKYDAEYAKKQQAIKQSYTEKLKAIDASINATIAQQAKLKGYDMVISKGVVIYGGDDITADVLKVVK